MPTSLVRRDERGGGRSRARALARPAPAGCCGRWRRRSGRHRNNGTVLVYRHLAAAGVRTGPRPPGVALPGLLEGGATPNWRSEGWIRLAGLLRRRQRRIDIDRGFCSFLVSRTSDLKGEGLIRGGSAFDEEGHRRGRREGGDEEHFHVLGAWRSSGCCWSWGSSPPTVSAAGRVALVVGNSTYAHIGRLPNPENDAARHGGRPRGASGST